MPENGRTFSRQGGKRHAQRMYIRADDSSFWSKAQEDFYFSTFLTHHTDSGVRK
jgi:hypothetical protein